MKVIEHNYKWNGELGKRNGEPPYLIHHHEAGYGSAEQVHAAHVALGWRGIAYHYLVRLDGSVHRGRPEWAMGGHALNFNHCIGVCAEGELHKKKMPAAQMKALRDLTRDIHRRHPGIIDKRHSDLNATACPGKFYPWAYITAAPPRIVPVSRYAELKRLMVTWAKAHNAAHPEDAFTIPKVRYVAWWGNNARLLAKRVSYRIRRTRPEVETSESPTYALYRVLKGGK